MVFDPKREKELDVWIHGRRSLVDVTEVKLIDFRDFYTNLGFRVVHMLTMVL